MIRCLLYMSSGSTYPDGTDGGSEPPPAVP
jgi:hypothetical protein